MCDWLKSIVWNCYILESAQLGYVFTYWFYNRSSCCEFFIFNKCYLTCSSNKWNDLHNNDCKQHSWKQILTMYRTVLGYKFILSCRSSWFYISVFIHQQCWRAYLSRLMIHWTGYWAPPLWCQRLPFRWKIHKFTPRFLATEIPAVSCRHSREFSESSYFL